MKPNKNDIRNILGRYLSRYGEPSQERSASAVERVWEKLKPEADQASLRLSLASEPGRVSRFRFAAIAAALLLLLLSAALIRNFVWMNTVYAVVVAADGEMVRVSGDKTEPVHVGDRAEANEVLRANGGGGEIELADGSRIEMNSNSELWQERADDGVRIHLNRGSIIVDAVKQSAGYLSVQTNDVIVAVTGTVFFVNAEAAGSRVAVIQGEVQVQQQATLRKLLPTEQLTTNPLMEAKSVREQIAWSRHAESYLTRLQQSTPATNAAESRVAFEEASIRPSSPTVPAAGQRGGGISAGGCSGGMPQVDPVRLAMTNTTIYTVITRAYNPQWAEGIRSDCLRASALDLLTGGPGWIKTDLYDIQAKIPDGSTSYTLTQFQNGDAPKLQAMLRTLLTERFRLVLHHETREMPIYELKVGKDGAKRGGPKDGEEWIGINTLKDKLRLVPGSVGLTAGIVRDSLNGAVAEILAGRKVSMADLASTLAGATRRPVVDRTGLMGQFNFDLDAFAPPNYSGAEAVVDMTIFTALEDQLGLKLESSKASIPVLVIDRVEKPSEN